MSTFTTQECTTDKSQLLSNSLNAGRLSQRKYAFGAPKSSLTSENKGKTRLQTQLSIGASNDPLEQEARGEDQVLAAPAHSAIAALIPIFQFDANFKDCKPLPFYKNNIYNQPQRPDEL